MTPEQRQELINFHLTALSEHFDAVQILTNWCEQSETRSIYRGAGNWHARQGMAHEFIKRDTAQENAESLRNILPPPEPPDDSEAWKNDTPRP